MSLPTHILAYTYTFTFSGNTVSLSETYIKFHTNIHVYSVSPLIRFLLTSTHLLSIHQINFSPHYYLHMHSNIHAPFTFSPNYYTPFYLFFASQHIHFPYSSLSTQAHFNFPHILRHNHKHNSLSLHGSHEYTFSFYTKHTFTFYIFSTFCTYIHISKPTCAFLHTFTSYTNHIFSFYAFFLFKKIN